MISNLFSKFDLVETTRTHHSVILYLYRGKKFVPNFKLNVLKIHAHNNYLLNYNFKSRLYNKES